MPQGCVFNSIFHAPSMFLGCHWGGQRQSSIEQCPVPVPVPVPSSAPGTRGDILIVGSFGGLGGQMVDVMGHRG